MNIKKLLNYLKNHYVKIFVNIYNVFNMMDNTKENLNLSEIENYYKKIFFKYPCSDKLILIFNGELLRKEDNCPLFVKYMTKVIDYYYNKNKKNLKIIADLKNINKKTINIDFIIKFVKLMKNRYDGVIIMDQFYVINCPKFIKSIYQFIKPFLHSDTRNKIKLIKENKTLSLENYI